MPKANSSKPGFAPFNISGQTSNPQRRRDNVITARQTTAFAAILIVAAGLAAYSGGLSGPFIFDDPSSITANPTIRHLWPLWDVLATPRANVTV